MAHGQGPTGGTLATVRDTVWDRVPAPPPPLGLASYTTVQYAAINGRPGSLGVGGWNLRGPGWA